MKVNSQGEVPLFCYDSQDALRNEVFARIVRGQENSHGIDVYVNCFNAVPWLGANVAWIVGLMSNALVSGRSFRISTIDDWRLTWQKGARSRTWWQVFDDPGNMKWQPRWSWLNILGLFSTLPNNFRYPLERRIPGTLEKLRIINTENWNGNKVRYVGSKTRIVRNYGSDNSPLSIYNRRPEWANELFFQNGIPKSDTFGLWKSYLCQFVFRPKLQSLFPSGKIPKIGEKYIAVHARRGDKVKGKNQESKFIESESYFSKAYEIANDLGMSHVHLISDSDQFIEEFVHINEMQGCPLDLTFDRTETRRNGYPTKILEGEIQEHPEVVKNEFCTAIRNLAEMIDASHLIGSHASWYFQLARRLRTSSSRLDGDCTLMESDEDIPGRPSYLF